MLSVLPSQSIPSTCDGFQCPFGKCIPHSALCDSRPDCADFSDEPATCRLPSKRCERTDGPVVCG